MPMLEKNTRFTAPKGSRSAVGKVNRLSNIDRDIKDAFLIAYTNFVEEFGRCPHFERVQFFGGATTFEVVFEICELPEDE